GKNGTEYRTVRKRVASLLPSPENQELYRAVYEDPDIGKLAASIQKLGLQEPLLITQDNYIVSGHRRHYALESIGQAFARCRVLPFRRDSLSTDQYLAVLREHNHQRNKTVAEQVREELVDIDPQEAHRQLCELRDKSIYATEYNGVEVL